MKSTLASRYAFVCTLEDNLFMAENFLIILGGPALLTNDHSKINDIQVSERN